MSKMMSNKVYKALVTRHKREVETMKMTEQSEGFDFSEEH